MEEWQSTAMIRCRSALRRVDEEITSIVAPTTSLNGGNQYLGASF
jgi:hypothetical protein